MDEVDSGGPAWALSHQEPDPWSQKPDTVETSSSDLNQSLSGHGFMTHPSFTCSSSVDCGFPSLQSSLTASIDSGYPSLQTSAVSLESSFSSFQRSSSLSLSFNEKGAAESFSSYVLSPDEGYDDVDSAVDSAPKFGYFPSGDTAFIQSKLQHMVNSPAYSEQAFSDSYSERSSYYAESVSGSSYYTTQPDEPHVDNSAGYLTLKPAELAILLKAGLEKYLLIDSRSFLEYNTSHIQQSTNVCCSKLVKRRLQRDKINIKDFLMQTCHIDIDEFMDVIVYDQCTDNCDRLTDDNFFCVLLNKLSCTFNRVALLKGGFLAFQAMYPSLCESKTNNYRCAALTSLSQPCLPVSNVGPTRILPFLYLGSQQDALSSDIVKVNEITYILNVSTTCIKPGHISDAHFLRIPVNDNYSAKLIPYFEQAFQFLDKVREANGCCLVHCLAGISRSPTLAIAYIMKYLNMSSDDAYRYVKDKRPTISPNFNFLGQLLEFEKQLKHEKGLNTSSSSDSISSDKFDASPKLTDFSSTRNSMTTSCPSMSWEQPSLEFSPPTIVSRKLHFQSTETQNSQGSSNDKSVTLEDGLEKNLVKGKHRRESLPLTKSPVKHFFKGQSLKLVPAVPVETHTARPNMLNLGIDTSRRLPASLSLGIESSVLQASKSLSDIKEASETPSPIVNSESQGYIHSTSNRHKFTNNAPPLLSPFPCGETTIPVHSMTEDQNYVPYSGNIQRHTNSTTAYEYSSVVTSEKSKHCESEQVLSSPSESKSVTDLVTPMTPDTPSATLPFSFSGPFLKAGGKRPLRSSLSLSLSPIAPHTRENSSTKSEEAFSAMSFEPSACKIERKLRAKSHEPESSNRSNIPTFAHPATSCTSPSSVTMSHKVKLKSFNLSASLPLSLAAQSPTTSLARLHFGSAENSDSENESAKMDTSDISQCSQPSRAQLKLGFKSLNESLEKLSSFPSTSLDKLNFTPCLSSSNENLNSSSTTPRTSGVKRPLNNDVHNLKETDIMSPGSRGSSINSSSSSSVSSPTNTQTKVVVKKREGRAKRPMVRPNSIAFSTYPTFDLGSDCQDSPSSASSSASQDDTSELYTQNGKKSKPSEYMTDVRFRLGRYSEREVYRQITAAMEAAMMKSQSFDGSRKSRSLDDILSSEDDSSAPNCEFSHFERVLRRCGLNRDRFASPPLLLEKLACGTDISEHYQSSSSLSSTSSHTSLHGSMELIQVS